MVLVVACGLITAFQPAESASAAVASDFNPGNIISDATFYDSGSMSVSQIQAFLNSKVSSCRAGYTCLKDYRQDTTSQPTQVAGCAAYTGRSNQSSASIIFDVSQACGINPQVLIVLLEKEQSLVSASSPGAGSYRSATGFACPDTRQCDSRYYGFFNQVYNAALQFKRYQYYPTYFNYRAGRMNSVQWSPEASCGSSSLYIENQATAGLYIYTPYRPNAAAMSNLYGTGDGCSAYGNRNFWRMFTDWFGNTRGGGYFVRSEGSADVYLISGSTKYFVPSMDVYNALAALGPLRTVSGSYLSGYSASNRQASTTIKDPSTGDVYRVEGGQKHRYPSCELISTYGSSCGAAVDLTTEQLGRFPTGAEVTSFFVVGGSPTVYMVAGLAKHAVFNWNAVIKLNRGTVPYLSTVDAAVAGRLTPAKVLLEPLGLVKSATDPRVYLVDGLDRLIGIPSFAMAAEIDARGYSVVPDAVIAGYQKSAQELALGVRCNNQTYVLSQGYLRLSESLASSGMPITDVTSAFCTFAPIGLPAGGPALFVKSPDSSDVHVVRGGQISKVPTWGTAIALNGGSTPQVVVLSSENIRGVPSGPAILPPASLVRTNSDPTIYMTDGLDKKLKVGSFVTTTELGIGGWSYSDAGTLSRYSSAEAALSRQVACNGVNYFAAGGSLFAIAAANVTGLATTPLSDLTCAELQKAGSSPLTMVFVKAVNSPVVYRIVDGTAREVPSWDRLLTLNGGGNPTILTASAGGLADIKVGAKY